MQDIPPTTHVLFRLSRQCKNSICYFDSESAKVEKIFQAGIKITYAPQKSTFLGSGVRASDQ